MTLEHIQIMRQCIVVYIYTQTDVFLHQKVQTYVAQDTSIIKQHEHVPDTNSYCTFLRHMLELGTSKTFQIKVLLGHTTHFIHCSIY